jgi:hypothetical protein
VGEGTDPQPGDTRTNEKGQIERYDGKNWNLEPINVIEEITIKSKSKKNEYDDKLGNHNNSSFENFKQMIGSAIDDALTIEPIIDYQRFAELHGREDYHLYSAVNSGKEIYAVLALPVLFFLGAEIGIVGGASLTWNSYFSGVGLNTFSQTIANGGDIKKVNVIEAGLSGFNGFIPIIFGETINWNYAERKKGIQTPQTLNQIVLQVGGGLISGGFSKYIGGTKLFENGASKQFGKIAEFSVETGTNVLPKLEERFKN